MLPVERLLVLLFERYPKLHKGAQFIFRKSICTLIDALSDKPGLMKSTVNHIIYQCLIRTCSCALGSSQNQQEVPALKQSPYEAYLPVWEVLLNERSYKSSDVFYDKVKCESLKEMVYDELLNSVLVICKKLNLNASKDKEEEGSRDDTFTENNSFTSSSDPTSSLVAEMPRDFEIFVNLVDFCSLLLVNNSVISFSKWMVVFTEEIITLSSKYPLVSGFYKLLQCGCQLGEQLHYFDETGSMEKSGPSYVQNLLFNYAKEVVGRMKQFKDDLLCSCLMFILVLPVNIIHENLNVLVLPFQLTFKLGLTHLPLAEAGLKALENLHAKLDKQELDALLVAVLPCLDDYLQTGYAKNAS